MTKTDPLGLQPRPRTGKPTFDPSNGRAESALVAIRSIWVEHEPQERIIASLRSYVRANREVRGVPLNGRRLSQPFQAGKSSIAWRLKELAAQERAEQGLPPNPNQILIVTINKRMTLRQFYQAILVMLEDDFYDAERIGPHERERDRRRRERRSAETLLAMIADWGRRLGVELLVVDEVQRLDRVSPDAEDVTTEIQTILDRGVMPILLLGNEASRPFLERNRELAVRLGSPFALEPLREENDRDMALFIRFCREYDRQLDATGCMRRLSDLGSADVSEHLFAVSGGHVGRAARIIQEAAVHAAARDADFVEAHDLSRAIRDFAIPIGWIEGDPFSTKYA